MFEKTKFLAKVEFNEVQKIFDENGVKLDARKEDFGYTSTDVPGCGTEFARGGWSWGTGIGGYWNTLKNGTKSEKAALTELGLTEKTFQAIQDEMFDNAIIRKLFDKSEQVRKGEIEDDTLAQQYSIRVTDFEGNALAKDRIIVESKNGHHVEMSVSDFAKLDRKEIAAMLR